MVGQTPWSAAGPLAGFLLRSTKADEGVGRGPGGPPYCFAFLHFHSDYNRDMRRLPILLVLCRAAPLGADVTGCACVWRKPETLEARECALCREAEKQPAEPLVFFLKDVNPRKPNRLLALPRFHGKGQDALADMTPQQRLLLWTAAIEKAKSLWGDQWGLAVNGEMARTQCHAHIHIGKLLERIETARFVEV